MVVAKTILIIVYFIVCLALIVLAMMQTKEDGGASSTIVGSSANNFFDKNKGRTKEGRLKRMTITLAIVFAILTIALSIIYIV